MIYKLSNSFSYRALQYDLGDNNRVGWMCPETTSESKIENSEEEVKAYVRNVFAQSRTKDYILAPIFEAYV